MLVTYTKKDESPVHIHIDSKYFLNTIIALGKLKDLDKEMPHPMDPNVKCKLDIHIDPVTSLPNFIYNDIDSENSENS